MAYFPDRLMPLTQKQDTEDGNVSSSAIRASDYNLHDEEIRNIEEYLGKTGGSLGLGLPKGEVPGLKIYGNAASSGSADERGEDSGLPDLSQGNTFNAVSKLIDIINNMSEYAGQGSISGYLHSGHRVIFPETIHSTFLRAVPGTNDTVLNVGSTDGFPRQGVVSILNDVRQGVRKDDASEFQQATVGGTSMVEWVRYSDKNATQLLNCQRGFLNTTRGPHSGSFKPVRQVAFDKNYRNICVTDEGLEESFCTRQWPWYRYRYKYSMPFFGIQGSWRDMILFIVRYGARVPLVSEMDPEAASLMSKTARDLDLLTYDRGVPFLLSKSQDNIEKKRMGWAEANSYIEALETAKAVSVIASPEDFLVGTIPVFAGKVGLGYGVSSIMSYENTKMDAMQIVQTADARVYCFLVDAENSGRTLHAVVGYSAYFMSGITTTSIRSRQ